MITGMHPAAIASKSALWASLAPRIIKQNVADCAEKVKKNSVILYVTH